MYRRPKFLELLLEIRQEMALEADYDVDLFVEIARNGQTAVNGKAMNDVEGPAELPNVDPVIPAIPALRRPLREVKKR